jgi:hypothetical protein
LSADDAKASSLTKAKTRFTERRTVFLKSDDAKAWSIQQADLAPDNNSATAVSRIRPGDRGKVGSGWLTRPLSSQIEIHLARLAEFTSSSGGVRAPSVNAKKELGGPER